MANNAGYLLFLRDMAGIPETAVGPYSAYLWFAYQAALDVVNKDLQRAAPWQYDWAVYNLATDNLIAWCPDAEDSTFFADLRTKFGINSFIAGVVSSASDNGTSESIEVPASLKNLLLGDLSNLKTPFGRAYLEQAQKIGSNWGIS